MRRIPFVSTLLCLLLLVPALAGARFDTRLNWQTLETEHFLIHYHGGVQPVAEQAARIAEDVHQRLTGHLQWQPSAKTHLILADVSDASNGQATPFPYNRIIVHLSPPLEEPLALTDREAWLRIVLTHEYAHILHLDTVRRYPWFYQKLFGRAYFPNLFQPQWLIEGIPTYLETEATSGGRGRSSYTDMVLRMAVLEERFPSPAQAGVFLDSWPDGEVPYLFGTGFVEHLSGKYGPQIIADFSHTYAGRPLPLMVDSSARIAQGTTFKAEWLQWQQDLRKKYRKVEERLNAEGLTDYTRLSQEGFENIFPSPSPDGKQLVYSAQTSDRPAELRLMQTDGSSGKTLMRRLFTPASAAVSWLAKGQGLVYSKLDRDAHDNLYFDLYSYDLQQGREMRLTRGLRTGSPDVLPAAGKIIFATYALGKNRLATADMSGQNLSYLTSEADNRLFFSPKWSPGGDKIAVGTKTATGKFIIQLLDAAGVLLGEIPHGDAINTSPAWSPDGQTLFFTSDRSGIFNIYAYSLGDQTLARVSNLLGGAFSPAVSADGRALYFSAYHATGFDIASMPLAPEDWVQLASSPVLLQEEPDHAPSVAQAEVEPRPYSPWASLLPHHWFPWLGSDEEGTMLGAITSGQDPLGHHNYAATYLYGFDSGRSAYQLLYRYDGIYPELSLFASDQDVVHVDFFPGDNDYWERRRSFGFDLRIPFAGVWSRHSLIPGYRYQKFRGLTDSPFSFPDPDEGQLSGLRLTHLFDNSVRPPRAISPEEGRRVALAVEHNNKDLGSDFSLTKYSADWREFTALPWSRHHVLATRIFGGMARGDVLDQRAFQVGGDLPGDLLTGIDSEFLPLRGYGFNEFRGQRAVLGSLEYRFPITNLEKGPGNGPLFFRRLHGALFYEGADAFDSGGIRLSDFRTSAGGELRLDADLGYFIPLTLRLVAASGFDEEGEDQLYLSFWLRF